MKSFISSLIPEDVKGLVPRWGSAAALMRGSHMQRWPLITIKSWFQVSIPLQHGRGFPSSQFKVLKSGSDEACDVQVYDVEKCFDSLWVQECINTLYENGFKNDKLVLLYEETINAKIAIKTPNWTTTRKDIKNIIMQGTVFGSLICTSVMDKLAKIFYQNPELVYKYKYNVEVPVLGMVDDVLCQGCISCGPCSYPELTGDHVLPSA